MKYIILVGDGMGDLPIEELEGKTPLEFAATPNMDRLAGEGLIGLAQTVPQGKAPGSDTANMSLLGYDPDLYHTGRAPIEAAAMGVELAPDDIAFRCNLVTLDWSGKATIMADYSSGHIDSASAAGLIRALQAQLGKDGLAFHPGISYRHLLVWRNGPLDAATAPPHDHSGQPVDDLLGGNGELEAVSKLTRASWPVLQEHAVNLGRVKAGQPPANSIWLWGQGTKPSYVTYQERFGLSGLVVSAVDLVKGLGVLAGLEVAEVPGATGWLDTNYAGKVAATLEGLASSDMAYLHVEAPDEASHVGKLDLKLEAIELFDSQVVGPLLEGMAKLGEHRILLATDHFTPLSTRTHGSQPVPYVLWDSAKPRSGASGYNEAAAAQGIMEPDAYKLAEKLVEGF